MHNAEVVQSLLVNWGLNALVIDSQGLKGHSIDLEGIQGISRCPLQWVS